MDHHHSGRAWERTELRRLVGDVDLRAAARQACAPNTLGITPDHVHAELLVRLWQWTERRERPASGAWSGELWDREGFVRSRARYAYRGLVVRAVAARTAHERAAAAVSAQLAAPVPGGRVATERAVAAVGVVDDVDDARREFAETARVLQRRVTRRLAELGPRDDARARALSALLAQLAIAANGGALPEVVPERGDRVEAVERERCAAAWLADPRLRTVGAGPDDSATRKRRQRLLELVREEFELLAADAMAVPSREVAA